MKTIELTEREFKTLPESTAGVIPDGNGRFKTKLLQQDPAVPTDLNEFWAMGKKTGTSIDYYHIKIKKDHD